MIINNTTLGKIASIILPRSAPAGPASAAPSVPSDHVSLSSRAREASALLGAMKALPESRGEKVSDVSARLQAGEPLASGSAIAEKLLSDCAGKEP